MKQKNSNKKAAGEVNKTDAPATVKTVQTVQTAPEVIQNIELSMITCNSFNPRRYRTEEDLEELKQSIVNFGIIQPITIRRKDENYEIVCGERRYRASLMAGLTTIPAIIKCYTDEEAMEITILENLQRRDINPVEEALSFGKLMDVRGYSIEDLVKQFGKTDKYIRSRLQLRNLIDSVQELLAKEEITMANALELARFCPDIQEDVYKEHLGDDSYLWKNVSSKDFRRLLDNEYSSDLSRYEFDKTGCEACRFNSSVYDLFSDGNCGSCQNLECLRKKRDEFILSETKRLMDEKKDTNVAICITPNSLASSGIVEDLIDTGHEIYETVATPLPVEPVKPVIECFESEDEYKEAVHSYSLYLERYNIHNREIEEMVQQGKAQFVIDVSRRTPALGYRVVPETNPVQPKGDTVEHLRNQDKRNREIAFEKGLEDIKRLVKESELPDSEFQPMEEKLVYLIMLLNLRKENYERLGINLHQMQTVEESTGVIDSLTEEQKNLIRRDYILKNLLFTSGDSLQSRLLIDFTTLHFPDRVEKIKEEHNETYKKRHIKIEDRIRELQPVTTVMKAIKAPAASVETIIAEAEIVEPDEETGEQINLEPSDEPDLDDTPLYPGLPDKATIGNIPEEEEELFELERAEIAA